MQIKGLKYVTFGAQQGPILKLSDPPANPSMLTIVEAFL